MENQKGDSHEKVNKALLFTLIMDILIIVGG
ncbi:SHP2/SHP3 family peptide pheromone [Streptococcus pyogenes]|nr:SHP2/SHP3 family peptide pheromone [Streptococcus pyogenes]